MYPIRIHPTHLTLPSGDRIPLDADNSFTPTDEFWQLWKQEKDAIKRDGIAIMPERGKWRGYVRKRGHGFSTIQAQLHESWIAKARTLAKGAPVETPILPLASLTGVQTLPCRLHREYQLVAKICKNETFQLRLFCPICQRKTPGAIKWDHFTSDDIIRAIAHALQNANDGSETEKMSLFDEILEVDRWV